MLGVACRTGQSDSSPDATFVSMTQAPVLKCSPEMLTSVRPLDGIDGGENPCQASGPHIIHPGTSCGRLTDMCAHRDNGLLVAGHEVKRYVLGGFASDAHDHSA